MNLFNNRHQKEEKWLIHPTNSSRGSPAPACLQAT